MKSKYPSAEIAIVTSSGIQVESFIPENLSLRTAIAENTQMLL